MVERGGENSQRTLLSERKVQLLDVFSLSKS